MIDQVRDNPALADSIASDVESVRIGEKYMRQLGWYNPEDRNDHVTFIGVGGIGSFAAFGASKLGIPRITLIDPDEVEVHNQPNQFYSIHDCGEAKVDALAGYLLGEGGHQQVDAIRHSSEDVRYLDPGVVVSGLDSMAARKSVWEQHVKLNPKVPLYIDGRLGGQLIVVYAVNPTDMEDVEAYEATLHSDDEGIDAPCTERGVIDVGLAVSALITRMLRLHFSGEQVDRITLLNQATLSLLHGGWVE
jgi:molybdopterin/thiamine biosynthesis adenylyltransferase